MTSTNTPAGRSPRTTTRGLKPREEPWPELIAAATRVFYDKGCEGASLQEIANELGMLKGSLITTIEPLDGDTADRHDQTIDR